MAKQNNSLIKYISNSTRYSIISILLFIAIAIASHYVPIIDNTTASQLVQNFINKHTNVQYIPMLLCTWLCAWNVLSFAEFFTDKIFSKVSKTKLVCNAHIRVPEKVLLFLLGMGPLGGLAGMLFAAHKTRKPLFWGVLLGSALVHCILFYALYLAKWNSSCNLSMNIIASGTKVAIQPPHARSE